MLFRCICVVAKNLFREKILWRRKVIWGTSYHRSTHVILHICLVNILTKQKILINFYLIELSQYIFILFNFKLDKLNFFLFSELLTKIIFFLNTQTFRVQFFALTSVQFCTTSTRSVLTKIQRKTNEKRITGNRSIDLDSR